MARCGCNNTWATPFYWKGLISIWAYFIGWTYVLIFMSMMYIFLNKSGKKLYINYILITRKECKFVFTFGLFLHHLLADIPWCRHFCIFSVILMRELDFCSLERSRTDPVRWFCLICGERFSTSFAPPGFADVWRVECHNRHLLES